MKKLLLRIIGATVLIFAVVGLFLILKGSGNGITGRLVSDMTKNINNNTVQNIQDTVDKTSNQIEKVGEETGITETIKKKTNEILGIVDTKNLIAKMLELRTISKRGDLVETANKISELNQEIESIDNPSLNTNWQIIIGCAYDKCGDEPFLSLVDSASAYKLKGSNEIIHSIIETHNFWDGKNILKFSESLSRTDKLIKGMDDKKISSAWTSVVECNNKCSDFTDRIFELIKLVNEKQ